MEVIADKKEEIKFLANSAIADYELLSGMFIYPADEGYAERIKEVYQYLSTDYPDAAITMQPFVGFLDNSVLKEKQELFLRSFDVQAITTLDIGFTLFGEDFKRGQLLVNLNREHREAGNECFTELSDHLPNVLRLLPKMKDHDMRNEIALRLVIPALEKMIEEFNFKKIEKKDEIYKKNLKTILDYSAQYRVIYQNLLQAVLTVMKKDFGYDPAHAIGTPAGVEEVDYASMACNSCSALGPTSGDYTKDIESEMNIEKF